MAAKLSPCGSSQLISRGSIRCIPSSAAKNSSPNSAPTKNASLRDNGLRREQNPKFYGLLERFEQATGCAALIDTSFNVRGEPIVCSPDDAYRCFINSEMDYLMIGNFLLDRNAQPHRRLERTFHPQPD